MNDPLADPDLQTALAAARAGAAALAPFLGRAATATDKPDGSPVTEADHASSRAALEALAARRRPGDVVVSEEAPPPAGWERARRVWFVDPLDGTREFVAGVPEFVVMVGLVHDGAPRAACILDPTTGRAWLGLAGQGAWALEGKRLRRLRLARRTALAGAREARSRSHDRPELEAFARASGVVERAPCGSMGLKAALIAEGRADFHLRPAEHARCAYWDSAAPAALVLGAGGVARDGAGGALRFDDPGLAHPGLLLCAPGLDGPLLSAWAARS